MKILIKFIFLLGEELKVKKNKAFRRGIKEKQEVAKAGAFVQFGK